MALKLLRRTQVTLDLVQLYPGSTGGELCQEYEKRRWTFLSASGDVYASLIYLEENGYVRRERHALADGRVRHEYYPAKEADDA